MNPLALPHGSVFFGESFFGPNMGPSVLRKNNGETDIFNHIQFVMQIVQSHCHL